MVDGPTLADMAYRFTPADRAAFKRCRRQWDFGARERRNLEPAEAAGTPGLEQAVRDALAVYYFPGMWDWQRSEVNLPDPGGGGRELVLADGRPIRYRGRVDLLAGDEHDRYWVVAHRLVDRFGAADDLLLDEELVATCLAMERGQDVAAVLEAGYRDRGPERVESGRLGAATWGTGRGAAPPRFDRG
jgi:hypothetical protein